MSVQLALLGQPQIFCDERPVVLPKKAVGLLAYLATHSEPQPRDQIIELLWPERDSVAGRKDMRNTLWIIRRTLGNETVATQAGRLTLGAEVWADVQVFTHLNRLDLYRGPFLDGLYVDDAPDFERWMVTEQAHWQAHYQTLKISASRPEGPSKPERMRADPLAFELTSVFHHMPVSPYEPLSAPRLLARGWDYELQGAPAEARKVFEAVYAATPDDDVPLASHCCLELAVVQLLQDLPEQAAAWLEQAGEATVGDLLALRLRNSISTALAASSADHASSVWFTQQYVLALLNAARCTLLQTLMARGDLTPDLQAMLARFTATVHTP